MTTLNRRSLIAGTLATSMCPLLANAARAAASLSGIQVPGFYRYKVGSLEITAVLDGVLNLNAGLFTSAEKGEAQHLLEQSFTSPEAIPAPVNAFLINTGSKLFLVDAGSPAGFAPNAGRLLTSLRTAGVEPEAIDAVLLTHLHLDHIGALAAGSRMTFPNAELVLAEPEHAFWMDETNANRAPEAVKPFFVASRAAVQPYEAAKRIRQVGPGIEVLPSVWTESAPGHTPGHTMYRVSSGADSLLIVGDIIHATALQFARPEWSIAFDSNQIEAAATRRRVLEQAASDRFAVAGMHIGFPGIGHVARESRGFRFVPVPWSPVL